MKLAADEPRMIRKLDDFDELLAGLETLTDWPEKVVVMQRNWIGRSEGARVTFAVAGSDCNAVILPAATCDGLIRTSLIGASVKFNTLGTTPTTAIGPQLAIPLAGKTIHDENNAENFDEWGRMTAHIGIDAPTATPLNPQIINYPYVNPVTEIFNSCLLYTSPSPRD